MRKFHLFLISDSTGETVESVSRACLAQFDTVPLVRHAWNMVRTTDQVNEIVSELEANPGIVLYTLVDRNLQSLLENECRRLQVQCVSILDPVVTALRQHLGRESHAQPGRQHVIDAEYFNRIEALNYVLSHDDGQSPTDLNSADVIVVGVSRTTKTPTCIYLANRGIKAANVALNPRCEVPAELLGVTKPLCIGLTKDPSKLVSIRRSRLEIDAHADETDYVDIRTVSEEVHEAERLFESQGWPVIDVTNRSVEEVASMIIQLYKRKHEQSI